VADGRLHDDGASLVTTLRGSGGADMSARRGGPPTVGRGAPPVPVGGGPVVAPSVVLPVSA